MWGGRGGVTSLLVAWLSLCMEGYVEGSLEGLSLEG